ncbi:MAG: hypothetical protein SWO11_02505 [Thermodesulfobacteriota bacterium]|nr:hypothetical protein [Thermodesulfobacteriota bacterium]
MQRYIKSKVRVSDTNHLDLSKGGQFSTAKLDYEIAEHRNLFDLSYFVVKKYENGIRTFIIRSN